MVGHFPDFFHGIVRRLLGERFVVECGILSAYHIKQDTKPSLVIRYVRNAAPVLRAQTPGIWFISTFVEIRCAVIF